MKNGKLVLMEQCYALDNFTSFVIPKMLSNQNHINSSGKIHYLKENQKKPFSNEYIFDALINLFDIETDDKQITVPDKNVFSPEYKQDIKDLRILRRTYPLQSILSK